VTLNNYSSGDTSFQWLINPVGDSSNIFTIKNVSSSNIYLCKSNNLVTVSNTVTEECKWLIQISNSFIKSPLDYYTEGPYSGDFFGNDIPNGTFDWSSLDECAYRCDKDPTCKFFQFSANNPPVNDDPRNNICFLKNGTSNYTDISKSKYPDMKIYGRPGLNRQYGTIRSALNNNNRPELSMNPNKYTGLNIKNGYSGPYYGYGFDTGTILKTINPSIQSFDMSVYEKGMNDIQINDCLKECNNTTGCHYIQLNDNKKARYAFDRYSCNLIGPFDNNIDKVRGTGNPTTVILQNGNDASTFDNFHSYTGPYENVKINGAGNLLKEYGFSNPILCAAECDADLQCQFFQLSSDERKCRTFSGMDKSTISQDPKKTIYIKPPQQFKTFSTYSALVDTIVPP
jgi:hypothetical protein